MGVYWGFVTTTLLEKEMETTAIVHWGYIITNIKIGYILGLYGDNGNTEWKLYSERVYIGVIRRPGRS